jgi:uncharacterized protein with ParB-like and HNH nuclease domain
MKMESILKYDKSVTQENHFTQKSISSLSGYTFIVEDYQRGYKWDFNQVLDLLHDIHEFGSNEKLDSYCLQPVAVKALNDQQIQNKFELVDGQQRLTTIYIILKIIGGQNLFDIHYKTREESESFLNNINSFPEYNFSLREDQTEDEIENELNEQWRLFVENNRDAEVSLDNVDNYHFFQAALVIRSYFENAEDEKNTFLKNLKEKVKVIWYQDPTNQTANQLFKNLNSGKIRLSASDLIKALFILNLDQENKLHSQIEFEQNKLASEWDDIEQQLHEPKFWSFIIGNTTRNYEDSRIGYLFEVLTNSIEHKNLYESYRRYSNNSVDLDWNAVTDLFFTLKEWYQDIYLYHRIGFLMRQNIRGWHTLENIFNEYKKAEDKSAFQSKLEEQLIQLFNTTKPRDNQKVHIYSLDTISYHDLAEVRNLLVLFNILTYERIMPDYRLDFDQFYGASWSVEHIQPQNPKDLSFDNVQVYLDEVKLLLGQKETNTENYEVLSALIADKPKASSDKEKRDYLIRFNAFMDTITNKFDLHGIGNLALLRSSDNSSIGNNSFGAKREQILEVFNSAALTGSFIPISTLQVFTKFHSKDDVQLKFWSDKDALDYKNSMADIMTDYLP